MAMEVTIITSCVCLLLPYVDTPYIYLADAYLRGWLYWE